MHQGRYTLGQEIVFGCWTHDANDTPTLPTLPPVLEIWSSAGTKVQTKSMPIMDRYQNTGWFQLPVKLNTDFATGLYRAVMIYVVGSYYGLDEDTFEVIAGGDTDGAALAMAWYQRPHAAYVVQQMDSGKLNFGRNPYL